MTRETITLTEHEQRRALALTSVLQGRLSVGQAATLLRLSVRHCQRLLAALRVAGPAILAHGNRGRPPHNRVPDPLRERVVTLARTVYAGFNNQHLTELLAEEQAISLSRPTIRALLRTAGVPRPRRRRPPKHRRQRPRMPQPGLLVQMDGSQHDWLEGRGPGLVLHGAIDDATNQVPAGCFRLQEDAAGYLWVLREMARQVGACPSPSTAIATGSSIARGGRPRWTSSSKDSPRARFRYERTVANDNTVRLEEHLLQLLPGPGGRSYAKARVEVHEHLDGTLSVVYQGRRLPTRQLTPPQGGALRARPRRVTHQTSSHRPAAPRHPRPRTAPWKPGEEHPWKRYAREGRKRKSLREAGVTFSLYG